MWTFKIEKIKFKLHLLVLVKYLDVLFAVSLYLINFYASHYICLLMELVFVNSWKNSLNELIN